MPNLKEWMNENKDLGILFLRLFIGIRVIYGVIDNIFSWEKMVEFSDFLGKFYFPFPLFSAILSVYVQFFGGLMILIGFKIRVASLFLIVNFSIALLMVHRADTFEGMTPAMSILFSCILFLFQGAGRFSIDHKKIDSHE